MKSISLIKAASKVSNLNLTNVYSILNDLTTEFYDHDTDNENHLKMFVGFYLDELNANDGVSNIVNTATNKTINVISGTRNTDIARIYFFYDGRTDSLSYAFGTTGLSWDQHRDAYNSDNPLSHLDGKVVDRDFSMIELAHLSTEYDSKPLEVQALALLMIFYFMSDTYIKQHKSLTKFLRECEVEYDIDHEDEFYSYQNTTMLDNKRRGKWSMINGMSNGVFYTRILALHSDMNQSEFKDAFIIPYLPQLIPHLDFNQVNTLIRIVPSMRNRINRSSNYDMNDDDTTYFTAVLDNVAVKLNEYRKELLLSHTQIITESDFLADNTLQGQVNEGANVNIVINMTPQSWKKEVD